MTGREKDRQARRRTDGWTDAQAGRQIGSFQGIQSKFLLFFCLIFLSAFIVISTYQPSWEMIFASSKKENEKNSAIQPTPATSGETSIIAARLSEQKAEPSDAGAVRSKPAKVLLFTYFRGGSSLLGQAFNKNPEAFYWFEPLAVLYRNGLRHPFIRKNSGEYSQLRSDVTEQLCQTIKDILNCNLHTVDYEIVSSRFLIFQYNMQALKPYRECLLQNDGNASDAKTVHRAVRRCLPLASDVCRRADIRAVKTIRLAAYMIDRILELDPDIQIIHYVRDPRGMLLSAMQIGHVTTRDNHQLRHWVTMWCHRLRTDRRLVDEINAKTGADRKILQLKYEDLITDFNRTLHTIYDHLHRKLPEQVIGWFRFAINAPWQGGPMGTARLNSTATAYRWRHYLSPSTTNVVLEICSDVIDQYGYQ